MKILKEVVNQIDVDLSDDNAKLFVKLLRSAEKKYNLEIIKIKMHGPGGGNPNVFFKGKEKDLRGWFVNEYMGDDDEFDEFFNR